jgi:similar to spore coat protein
MTKYLGLHETLDIHELLTFKNLCLTKAATMGVLATDEQLKKHILELKQFITKREDHQ